MGRGIGGYMQQVAVRFLGTGEAFDGARTNCAVLWEGARRVLFDCGPTVPWAIWRRWPGPDDLDAVYISHFHGDHLFGLPFLLTRMRQDGRKRPLFLFGQRGLHERVGELTRLAYGSTWPEAGFAVETLEVEPDAPVSWEGHEFATAESLHPWRNLSVRMRAQGLSFAYSGDGAATEATRALFAGVDLLVHEAFAHEEPAPGHGTVPSAIQLAQEAGVLRLALVHLSRELRARLAQTGEPITAEGLTLRVPEDGEEWGLGH